MNEFVYDSIMNEHERKNLYLKDLSLGKKVDKKSHEYILKLNSIIEEEKKYKKELEEKIKKLKEDYQNKYDKIETSYRIELFEANNNYIFYKTKVDVSYDFELEYKISKIKIEKLPEIIELYSTSLQKYNKYKDDINKIDQNKEKEAIEIYENHKKYLLEKLKEGKEKLKVSRDEGLISSKAYKQQKSELDKSVADKLEVFKLNIPSEDVKSKIKIAHYEKTVEVKSLYKIMQQDISDLMRKTPVEVEKQSKLFSYLSILIPGIGQLKNKQIFKAILFFIGALFIYFVAIPYCLGYGNYRGQGLKGLITLAKGGKKTDRSLIFMIEGLVAVIFMLISITISSLSFKDSYGVVKNMEKGIRPKNKFEILDTIHEEGFPYIVTSITFILLMFIVILPIFTTILLSFTGMDPNHQSKFAWIGLENYKLLITGTGIAGGPFRLILIWTIIWTLGSTTLSISVGFFLALLANNERIKGKTLIRTIYLLPWAVPAFITIMFFSIMSSSNGIIPSVLEGLFGGDWAIKSSANLTRIALILMQTWLGSSYVFLLSTGVLQGIPSDLYEAAEIDGATAYQKLTKITLPLVLFQTAPLLIGQYTFNFNNFSIIYLFNGGGPFDPTNYGNLAGSTDLLISYIFKLTIQKQYQSIGAAITIFISLGLMLLAYIGFKNSQAFKEEK